MKSFKILILAIGLVSIWACEKTLIQDNFQFLPADQTLANVKFINAYTSNVPAGAPGVGATRFYIYQAGAKLNGNALSSPGSWPGSTTYASLKPGSTPFVLSLDRRVGNDYGKPAPGDTAFKGNIDLQAAKFYSVFMIGASPSQELFKVEDKIINPNEGNYAVRFANFAVSATPKNIDFYSRREAKVIASAVAYKGITEFAQLKIADKPDTIDVRDAGQTKNLFSFNTFSPTSRRSYTFYAYGRGTTAPFAERLLNYTNR